MDNSVRRAKVEEEILNILRPALPDGVQCSPLPPGLQDEEALIVKKAAVWLIYGGGSASEPQDINEYVQALTWTWSVIVICRYYRNKTSDCLDLIETVINCLSGSETIAGRIEYANDRIIGMPDDVTNLVGYELKFAVKPYLRHL